MDTLALLKEEIESITSEDYLQEFVREALLLTPDFQLEGEIGYIKQVVANVRTMADVIDADDHVKDIMTCAAILHGVCKYDIEDGVKELDYLHMLHVRSFLTGLQAVASRDNYYNIMLLIESQDGFNSPIPQVMPSLQDPAHMWILPFAIRLAKEQSEEDGTR